ncbi:MAG: threonylcarbamoyl-AMP synthase [Flexistipes sinusarabici]|uniref:L-threonylcarbamoyladenylate synthase n=1 Tax=Flexistipes sinusarabici TaxID=2352 RepID=A0A5D0MR89_FLESI|nr:L-threonylcarbamoyladenylate synthase [Flexistipes sinusarabici]TYB34028.1 MAG: threonylcarbamoyl-AMP synthase [Flexistipes sinusarabici]
MLIIKADTANAVKVFKKAALSYSPVVFPTDTIYGIGAGFFDVFANEKISKIKGREAGKAFPVLISDIKQLDDLKIAVTNKTKKILDKSWPGPFTFILETELDGYYYAVNAGKVAVRLPDKRWLRETIRIMGTPFTATSANLSGKSYRGEFRSIFEIFKNDIDYFLYEEPYSRENTPSTIVDVSCEEINILRNPLAMDIKDLQ